MTTPIGTLAASATLDTRAFEASAGRLGDIVGGIRSRLEGVADSFRAIGTRMTLGMSVPLLGIGGLMVNAASDAEELQTSFDQTFGEMSDVMNAWAETAGNAMGRSTQEMQEGARALGMLFNQSAPTRQAAAELSQSFTELAQDASSYFNVDFDEALNKIRSGLIGEAEPLRAFGVMLSDNEVKARALADGIIRAGQDMTEQQKIMVRSTLIMEGLADAQGDVERTSDGLANRIRALKGQLHELAVEFGERLEPFVTAMVAKLQALADWISNLSPRTKDLIVKFAAFLALLGPISLALTVLVATVLPLLLLRFVGLATPIGVLLTGLSALVNPIGTLIVFLGRLALRFGLFSGLSGVAGLFLRLLGPIGLVITAIILFKDVIVAAFSDLWKMAQETLGPAFTRLMNTATALWRDLGKLFDDISASVVGEVLRGIGFVIGGLIGFVGRLVEGLILVGGGAVIGAIGAVLDALNFLLTAVRAIVQFLTGDFTGAWQTMADGAAAAISRTTNNLIAMMGPLGWIVAQLNRVAGFVAPDPSGLLGGVIGQVAQTVAAGAAVEGPATAVARGTPAAAESSGRKARSGASGPSAEELAARREMLRLEQALAVARAAGDLDEERSLQHQIDLLRLIDRYKNAGLSQTLAEAAARRDMALLAAAEATARERAMVTDQRAFDIQLAQIRGDEQHAEQLRDEEWLEERIAWWQERQYSLTDATLKASQDQLQIDDARAAFAEQMLTSQQRAFDLELARARGDDTRGLEAQARFDDRVRELQSQDRGLNRAEAEAIAMREGAQLARAEIQGVWRSTFRDGLRAAMNGDLKGFVQNWFEERTFNALSRVLDRLADRLADLFSQIGSGGKDGGGGLGSLLGGIGQIFGGGAGGKGAGIGKAKVLSLPGFAAGGDFKIGGFSGIDQNLLSVNGVAAARVGAGEVVRVLPAGNDNGGGKAPYFDLRGAMVTEDVLRQMNEIGRQAAERGAYDGAAMARGQARDANRFALGRR